jgi:hypothetical protein
MKRPSSRRHPKVKKRRLAAGRSSSEQNRKASAGTYSKHNLFSWWVDLALVYEDK